MICTALYKPVMSPSYNETDHSLYKQLYDLVTFITKQLSL